MTSPNKRNISTAWFTNERLTKEEKEKVRQNVLNLINDPTQKRFRLIIEEKKKALLRQERSKDQYSDSSWSHRQAHINGNMEIIDLVLNLLTIEE